MRRYSYYSQPSKLVSFLNSPKTILAMVGVFILCGLSAVGGWVTHIVHCIKTEEWGLLIGGALFAPIGVIHGWGIWFGWWG